MAPIPAELTKCATRLAPKPHALCQRLPDAARGMATVSMPPPATKERLSTRPSSNDTMRSSPEAVIERRGAALAVRPACGKWTSPAGSHSTASSSASNNTIASSPSKTTAACRRPVDAARPAAAAARPSGSRKLGAPTRRQAHVPDVGTPAHSAMSPRVVVTTKPPCTQTAPMISPSSSMPSVTKCATVEAACSPTSTKAPRRPAVNATRAPASSDAARSVGRNSAGQATCWLGAMA
mmetsp:Transcript_115530/g.333765  ORF Transcript_115530/g.333765 Transcript_115530/m.333765 type:complete len:237 (-) Transcript_115530:1783-2493(-)